MNGINTNYERNGIYQNIKDDTQVEAATDESKKSEKQGNTIYAGSLNLLDDPIGEKQAKAQRDALKEIMDTFSGEHSIDLQMREKRAHIKELDEDIAENQKDIRELQGYGAALKEQYGVTDDSEEEAELELLKKQARFAMGDVSQQLNEEELKKLQDIYANGLSEYQEQALGFYNRELSLESENEAMQKEQKEDTAFIKGVHKERIKRHDMIDSQKVAQDILEQASKEIVGMLVQEAVDHIDETLEENEKKEEDKDKTKEEDVQSDILKGEADKRVAEQKITREDIKGLAYDEQV